MAARPARLFALPLADYVADDGTVGALGLVSGEHIVFGARQRTACAVAERGVAGAKTSIAGRLGL